MAVKNSDMINDDIQDRSIVGTGSLGNSLRKAREQAELSVATVAKDLYLKERQIEALEEERFSDLPQESFARGFALKYADYLNLNTEEVGRQFNLVYPKELRSKVTGDIESPIREMGTVYREDKRLFHFNPALLLGAIAVIALAIFLMRTVSSAEEAQNAPKVIENSIDSSEQRQGASLNSAGSAVGSSGSAIGIGAGSSSDKDSTQ